MNTEDLRDQRRIESNQIATDYPWLANEIAAVMEAAYRRGFQQGALLSPDDIEIAEWRFRPSDADRYHVSTTPPKGRCADVPAIKRLKIEAGNASEEIATIVIHTD